MNRLGKCTNYAGCVRAYRSDEIIVSAGAFVCPECRHPLTTIEVNSGQNGRRSLLPGLAVLAVAAIVASSGVLYLRSRDHVRQSADAGPVATPLSSIAPTALAETPPPPALVENTPVAVPSPAASTAVVESPAPTPVVAATPGAGPMVFGMENQENRDVKNEVLKRIDLMPTISSENKDKLYMNVERARRMGKMLTIPFASGKTTLGAANVELLKNKMQTPEIQQLLQDPTVVLVILGYADTKGDDKTNLKISQTRAQNVLDTLRDKCGVANVLHSIGMGGSTLFDAQGSEKNRVVEIWAVLP